MSTPRAKAALRATLTVHQEMGTSTHDAVTNLLIDLEHLCKEKGINIKACEWQATWHITNNPKPNSRFGPQLRAG